MPDPGTTIRGMNAIQRELDTLILIGSFHFVGLSVAVVTVCALLMVEQLAPHSTLGNTQKRY